MKCQKHGNADAVGQCVECGAGVCVDCAKALEPFSSRGLRCAKCVEKAYRSNIAETEDENKKLLRNSIISIILYIIGAVLIILGVSNSNDDSIILIIAGVVCCGIFTGLTGWNYMKREEEEYEAKHGAEYVIDENGVHKDNHILYKLIYFVFGLGVGVLWTPIRVILNFKKRKDNSVAIKEMYEDIETLQSI